MVNPLMEESDQIPPETMSPLLSAPRLGVIKYNAYRTTRVAEPVQLETYPARGPQFPAAGHRA